MKIVSYETIQFVTSALLSKVHRHHASILHHYGDMAPQRQWGYEFGFWGHVTSSVT